jgi:catechol 2,3-dioxygenase-like lactoylglutathione lyase family enzyme
VAIGVSSIDRALTFYRDVIGLQVAVDHIEDFRATPAFATHRRGAYLRWADGDDAAFIVLDETLQPAGDRGGPTPLFNIGVHHFGFWVDDVDIIVERARAAGFEVVMKPSRSDSGLYGEPPGRRIRVAFLKDPDGNVVQLDQRC